VADILGYADMFIAPLLGTLEQIDAVKIVLR